jgi:hypothetical protein
MPNRSHPQPPTRLPRACQLALATLLTGVVLAGCGRSSPSSTAASVSGASATAASVGGASATASRAASSGSTTSGRDGSGPLAFADCMRANGVPNFPDPKPGGGFQLGSGIDPSSPAFRAAQAKCQKFMPLPGGASSFSPQVEAQALAQLRTVAQCMRRHGISDFPDPRATRPSNLGLGEYSEITDYMGVFLLFPATIDMQSPAWNQAAAACGSLAESFNHPHH